MLSAAGSLLLTTEFGLLEVSPGEVVVVQRGIRFSVGLTAGPARGYVLEVFQGHFTLPDLGPIGEWQGNPRTSCLQFNHLTVHHSFLWGAVLCTQPHMATAINAALQLLF